MTRNIRIRTITINDAAATLEIYRPYVEHTIISFEYEVPSLEEWRQRINTHSADYPWLVCEVDGAIVGYAYGSRHRYRTAYSWSPESTVYVHEDFHRMGIARVLYETLFSLLRLHGYINVYAGVGLPNIKSETFHEALGFYDIGIFRKVGYKFGNWHDTRWFQLHLSEHPQEPSFPKTTAEVVNLPEYQNIIAEANERLGHR